ncbi:MAG TPA: YbdK family carboxylate-amine ligase [Solirubrobacteraceae bacterium]
MGDGKTRVLSQDDEIGDAFGEGEPFTVGVEEELFLVDPVTGRQANSSAAVGDRLGDLDGRVERELHACQIELITNVCGGAGEAVAALGRLRRAVLDTGAGLIGSGTHPSAVEGEAEITDKTRYERIRELLGDAVATPVSGMHIHVGMPDPETAIRTFNGLRCHLPLLQALAANSPFRHGRDTGLESAREVTIRSWPRSGVPRAMRDFEDFRRSTLLLTRAADVEDYTWFWWKLRPHPRLGTVEVRGLDSQASLEDAAGLIALTHCLARHCAHAEPGPDPPGDVLEEGAFRAARYGVRAELPDADGRLRPVGELLDEALTIAREHADELGCAAELEILPGLIERGGGSGRQRAAYEIAGMDAVLRELTRLTVAASGGSAGPGPGPGTS